MEHKDINYIVVHCSATQPSSKCNFGVIRDWHMNDNGWSDIGYHFVIERDGTLVEGRSLDRAGAHVKGHNSESWGICLVGGIDKLGKGEFNFTKEQINTLGNIVALLKRTAPSAEVLGHRDFPGVSKECPCFGVKDWWGE